MVRNHNGSRGVADSIGVVTLYVMASKPHLEVQAAAWRELAKRARRLAGGLLDGPDRDRLLKYSAQLEEKAAGVEGGDGISNPANTKDNAR